MVFVDFSGGGHTSLLKFTFPNLFIFNPISYLIIWYTSANANAITDVRCNHLYFFLHLLVPDNIINRLAIPTGIIVISHSLK